jgi:hypothetical protein
MKVTTLVGMIPFEVERALCSRINRVLGRRPSSAPFLSGDTYRSIADRLFDEIADCDPRSIVEGSVVFVGAKRLLEFRDEMLPLVSGHFVLVSHQGDENIDGRYASIADHPMVLRWFAQNCVLEHPKVVPISIGLEDRWRHNSGEVSDFRRLARGNRPVLPRIAFGFTLGTNLEKRIPCYSALMRCDSADELPQPMNGSLYRKTVKKYMLVASPPGNGLDCHRTWEAIYMHAVPLVEDNYMNRRFRDEGLPLILVDSWDELRGWSEARVRAAYEAAWAEADPGAGFLDHWNARFQAAARGSR